MDESPALSAGAGRVPAAWLKLSPHAQLKPGQVDTLEAIASGGDLVSRQATGSGKSLTFMLPAVAGWQSGFAARQRCRDAQERAELPLPSLVLVLVPFVELMLDLQREADEYFAWLFETGRTPVRLRALAVIRSQAAPASAANLATTLPCAAEPVAATAAPDASPVVSPAEQRARPKRTPTQIEPTPPPRDVSAAAKDLDGPLPFPSLLMDVNEDAAASSPGRRLVQAAKRVFSRS